MTAHFDHRVCDEITVNALAIIDAVRRDDVAAFLDEIDAVRAIGGPAWATALIVVLASLVPDDRSVGQLTEWMQAVS